MDYEMSLAKFLSRVTNLTGKDLHKLRHEDVQVLFPYLRRASFEKIDEDPGLLCFGQIILVNDGKRIIPYYNPFMYHEQSDEKVEVQINIEKKKINDKHYDYEKLSIYELRCLLKKRLNSYRNQILAKKELERRGANNHKKYKRSIEKELVLRRMKDEGY